MNGIDFGYQESRGIEPGTAYYKALVGKPKEKGVLTASMHVLSKKKKSPQGILLLNWKAR